MSEKPVDLDAARQLTEDLSKKLADSSMDAEKLRALREEVDALRDILNGPNAQHFWIEDRLKGMEAVFERAAVELLADGIKVSNYVTEIGRILGVR